MTQPTSRHIPPYQIAMAQENIDLTLEILRAAPEGTPMLDKIVFSFIDRKHLSEREHVQICCLTIGLLFLALAEKQQPPTGHVCEYPEHPERCGWPGHRQ